MVIIVDGGKPLIGSFKVPSKLVATSFWDLARMQAVSNTNKDKILFIVISLDLKSYHGILDHLESMEKF
jgi:hypothetical protein